MSAYDAGRRQGPEQRDLRAERLDLLLNRAAGTSPEGPAGPEEPSPGSSVLAERQRGNRRRRVRGKTAVRAVLAFLALFLVALPVWWALSPRPGPAQAVGVRSSAAPSRAEPSSTAARTLLVHVSGAVQKPGVIQLPESSRLFQALERAGGAAQDARLDSLNLAAEVKDGQHIHVPARAEQPFPSPAMAPGPGTAPEGAEAVGLNSATVEQLMALPRVGKVLAERIVAWRQQHGRFNRLEDLDAVDGIGPKLVEQLLPKLSLD